MSRTFISPAVGLLAAGALGACATPDRADSAAAIPRTPTEQWRVELTTETEEILLAPHAAGLSPRQADALATFAALWRESDGGVVTIQAPSSGADPTSVYRAAEAARAFLLGHGVPRELVRTVGYHPQDGAPAPLRIGYERTLAVLPACGREWTNFTRSAENRPQPNFGCAVTANMAAQIAHPSDLAEPRPLEPGSAARRAYVIEKYRRGEPTATTGDNQANGAISRVLN